MKNIFLVIVFLISSSAFLSGQETTQENKNAPVITFENVVHDYGTIKQGADGNFNFTFKNTGKEPLIVNNVKSSCGCTVADYTKEPVNKGKSGSVGVRYNTNIVGSFMKTITIYSNASNNPVVLTIKGTVEKAEEQQ
jgi:hypothetical protein